VAHIVCRVGSDGAYRILRMMIGMISFEPNEDQIGDLVLSSRHKTS
jgi:hypothetical protein